MPDLEQILRRPNDTAVSATTPEDPGVVFPTISSAFACRSLVTSSSGDPMVTERPLLLAILVGFSQYKKVELVSTSSSTLTTG